MSRMPPRLTARAAGATLLLALLTLGLPGLGPGAVQAGPLADPTRPPSAAAAAVAVDRTVPRPPRAAEPDEAAPVLQGVQLPAHGAAVAMIDGQLVKAGDSVGRRRVIAIDSQGVLLDGRPGALRLQLLGGSAKQPAGSALAARSARYVPAAADAERAPGRTDRADRPSLNPPSPTTPGPLSVAGRTSP